MAATTNTAGTTASGSPGLSFSMNELIVSFVDSNSRQSLFGVSERNREQYRAKLDSNKASERIHASRVHSYEDQKTETLRKQNNPNVATGYTNARALGASAGGVGTKLADIVPVRIAA